MSAALHLAGVDDIDHLLRLVAAFHAEEGIEQTDTVREAVLRPLLEGSPHGAAYLIGPKRAPIGYVVVTFTWSLEFGGLDALIDELFVRPGVRGRGIGTEVLMSLSRALASAGVQALHLEVDRDNDAGRRLYEKTGFRAKERYVLMTRPLS